MKSIMVWGILGALDEEIALIKKEMEITAQIEIYERIFYKGKIYGKDIVLACCGIGKVNAAMCTTTLVRELGAEKVINVGIAGAIGYGLNILDVVISSEAVFHDQDEVMLKYYPKTEIFKADEELIALCKLVCMELNFFNFKIGRIASGDVFVSKKSTKDDIVLRTNPEAVEMEGAAIAHICHCSNVPFLIIRTMSDSADESAVQSYDNFIEKSANQSANIILNMLRK